MMQPCHNFLARGMRAVSIKSFWYLRRDPELFEASRENAEAQHGRIRLPNGLLTRLISVMLECTDVQTARLRRCASCILRPASTTQAATFAWVSHVRSPEVSLRLKWTVLCATGNNPRSSEVIADRKSLIKTNTITAKAWSRNPAANVWSKSSSVVDPVWISSNQPSSPDPNFEESCSVTWERKIRTCKS